MLKLAVLLALLCASATHAQVPAPTPAPLSLDEALRLIEPMDQAGIRKLVVTLQSAVEKSRGER